jgi:predicted ATPase
MLYSYMDNRFVVLSGCSGGGKSSLLEELRSRGYRVIDEPGRRIVQVELESNGQALPWLDLEAFAREAVRTANDDLRLAATMPGWVFFDRGLVDAAVALQYATNEALSPTLGYCYYRTIFLVPPWKEIYASDSERQHSFEEAVSEFERLRTAYETLGYKVVLLPKKSVQTRADLVLSVLSSEKTVADRSS